MRQAKSWMTGGLALATLASSVALSADDAPYLWPEAGLAAIQTAPGYAIDLVAAEPLVQDPVAVAFDAAGRMWVVEMTTYMLDVDGAGEEVPKGTISLITDKDGDGVLDTRNVVVDKVVLPRAVMAVEGGILYADHYSLYYVELDGVTAKSIEMVDEKYITQPGQNVEHRPNGLVLGLDNWIHNAGSERIYRLLPLDTALPRGATEIYRNARFKVALRTSPDRGQWGMDSDDFDRFYYTANSNMLMGDRANPFYLDWFANGLGDARWIASSKDSRVYPIRPTPGVNRASGGGMLDEEGKLISATSASGHAIYKSAQFPAEMRGASVVCEAVAFVCSARRISWDGANVSGERVYGKTELIASTEERFRPVNIHNAPDGSLYVVDMHRGLVQHVTYLTQYLKEYTLSQGLEKPYATGRIYRLRYAANALDDVPDLSRANSATLIAALGSANSWERQTARRLLLEQRRIKPEQLATIREMAHDIGNPVTRANALAVIDGLGALTRDDLLAAITSGHDAIAAMGLRLTAEQSDEMRRSVMDGLAQYSPATGDAATYYSLLLAADGRTTSLDRLATLWSRFGEHPVFAATMLAAFYDDLTPLKARSPAMFTALTKMRDRQLAEAEARANTNLPKGVSTGTMANGQRLYEEKAACAGCHGPEGKGIEGLAPKLAGSDWAKGNPDRLIALVLRGMHGPVTVDGELFDTPAIMPALMDNPNVSDLERANLLTYIRNAWGNLGGPIELAQVQAVRMATEDKPGPYDEAQLQAMYPD